MIELDIRRTKDKVLVVFHNERLAGKKICDLQFSDIIKINSNIPTLEKVLELIKGKILLNAEIKEGGYEKEVGALLLNYLNADEVTVSSFSEKIVKAFKYAFPAVKAALVVGINYRDALKIFKLIFFKNFANNFDALNINTALWDSKLVKLFKIEGKILFPWTLDDPEQIKKYLLLPDFSGVFTNFPDVALNIRKNLLICLPSY